MFNSTHTLVGLAIARTGLDEWVPQATWTAVIASNLPDIDIVTQFAGTTTYLDYHRGITHTILGTPILSLALAGVMYAALHGLRRLKWGVLGRYFLIALIAMSTHPLLDWANNYGVRPFLPFSGRWFYGDTLFIIDSILDLLLLIGIVFSYKAVRLKVFIAAVTLAIALAYIGGMIALRNVARREFESYAKNSPGVLQSAVSPDFLNPFRWTAFLQTSTGVENFRVDLLGGEIRRESRLTTSAPSPAAAAADATHTAAVFRRFARFPVTLVQKTSPGYRVLLIDFRFFRSSAQTALAAEIDLNDELRVEGESMSFVRSITLR